MSLPLVLTTVSIFERVGDRDRATPVIYQLVEQNVPATITGATGIGSPSQEQADALLHVDLDVNVGRQHRILDESTEQQWDVVWTVDREGLGLDMRIGGLIRVSGAA